MFEIDGQAERRRRRRATLLAVSALILLGTLAWANSFAVPFVFDDFQTIVLNPHIKSLSPLAETLFPDSGGARERALANLTFALNWWAGGPEVVGFHVVNLVIHLLAGLFLFGVLRRTLTGFRMEARFGRRATILAFFGTLVWMVHPLQTESVTYIVQRCESLMGLCFFGSLYMAIRGLWSERRSVFWDLGALALFLLGAGAKLSILMLPAVVFLYDWTFSGRDIRTLITRRLILYVGFFLSLAVLGTLAGKMALHSANLLENSHAGPVNSPLDHLVTQPEVVFHYIRLFFWPSGLCLDYGWPASNMGRAWPYAAFFLLVFALTFWGLWKRKPFAFALAAFFVALAPVSSFIPFTSRAAEHRIYLPSAALSALVILGAYRLGRRVLQGLEKNPLPRRLITGLFVLVAVGVPLVLVALTLDRNRDYETRLSIWTDTVEKAPENYRALTNLALALADMGEHGQAIPLLEKAMDLGPESVEIHLNLARSFMETGKRQEAYRHLARALEFAPGLPEANFNMGALLLSMGHYGKAADHLKKALEANPYLPGARAELGRALYKNDRPGEAIPYLEETLANSPDDVETRFLLAGCYAATGDYERARAGYFEVLKISPEHAGAHERLGQELARAGDVEGAVEHYRRAVELMPESFPAQYNLANLYGHLKNWDLAAEHYQAAALILPGAVEPHVNLGYVYAAAGKTDLAEDEYRKALEIKPGLAAAWYNLGNLLFAQERWEEASIHFEEALKLRPDLIPAQNRLAAARKHLEREKGAHP